MSRVVLYRCPECKVGEYDDDGTSGEYRPKCYKCGATFKAFEPVEYVPAALAQRLVEALTVCVENLETYLDQEGCVVGGMQPIKKAKAALAAAEEELK